MKFLHMADMHFDAIFQLLNSKSNLGSVRRLDQRFIFNNIIDKVKSEQIDYLFISGDLYEQKYIRKSTIDFINSKFTEIPNTHVFISPGNHDPFIKNSYYSSYEWSSNVKIFKGDIEKFETKDAYIYGFGFTGYNCFDCNLDVKLEHDKPNILLIHCSLDAQDIYNPIPSSKLKSLGFDYIALGHIHKTNFSNDNNMVYPGSPIAMGFDELGEHGVVVGEFTGISLNVNFVKTDNKIFIEKEIDITQIVSIEELIETINDYEFSDNEYIKIILTGNNQFEFNKQELEKHIIHKNIIKIKDHTKPSYDLASISKEASLKGIFVKKLLSKMDNEEYNKQEVEKAISIGLELFE